jgi:hypothetical protein
MELSSERFSVPITAPPEDQAAWTFYRYDLESNLRDQKYVGVLAGLFTGMFCCTKTLSSVLLSKYHGTYECEVQDLLVQFIVDADCFIDIGCAEGYYVNGVAYRYKIPCVGVDINPEARSLVLDTAVVNNLASYVTYSANIEEALANKSGKIVILIDVDGTELDVLENIFELFADNSNLLATNIIFIIESDFDSNMQPNTAQIVDYLAGLNVKIHSIVRQDPLRRFSSYGRHLSFMDQCVIGLEGRPAGQQWIVANFTS